MDTQELLPAYSLRTTAIPACSFTFKGKNSLSPSHSASHPPTPAAGSHGGSRTSPARPVLSPGRVALYTPSQPHSPIPSQLAKVRARAQSVPFAEAGKSVLGLCCCWTWLRLDGSYSIVVVVVVVVGRTYGSYRYINTFLLKLSFAFKRSDYGWKGRYGWKVK